MLQTRLSFQPSIKKNLEAEMLKDARKLLGMFNCSLLSFLCLISRQANASGSILGFYILFID